MVCTLLLDDVIKCAIGTGGLNTSDLGPHLTKCSSKDYFWGEWVVIEIIPWNKSMLRPQIIAMAFPKADIATDSLPPPRV